MLDEWTEAAEPRGDRLAALRMLADLARQRQQLERQSSSTSLGEVFFRMPARFGFSPSP